jgi:hypothetical protein
VVQQKLQGWAGQNNGREQYRMTEAGQARQHENINKYIANF